MRVNLLRIIAVKLTDVLLRNVLPLLGHLHHLPTIHQSKAKLVTDMVAATVDGPAGVGAWDPGALDHHVLNVTPCEGRAENAQTGPWLEDVPLLEFMYLIFIHIPCESYCRQLWSLSLLLYLCYIFCLLHAN